MFWLLNINGDVLLCILDYVTPDDIVNTAVTCRSLHILAERRLRRHEVLARKYSDIVCIPSWSTPHSQGDSLTNPAMLLRDLINNKTISYYPRKLTIGSYVSNQNPLNPANMETPPIGQILRGLDDAVREKLSLCKYWRPLTQRQFAAETFENEKLNIIVAVLIILLPNLQCIELRDPRGRDTVVKMLQSIATKTVSRQENERTVF